MEPNNQYSLMLLQLVANDATPMPIHMAAAITFKNFVKNNWHMVCGIVCVRVPVEQADGIGSRLVRAKARHRKSVRVPGE